jgi:hypothetical protein
MGILIAGLTGREMLDMNNFSIFPQCFVLWKCQDCRNYGNPCGIPTIAWKTLRVFHNPLEKLKNSFSTFPQYFFLSLRIVFLFTEGLVFLLTAVLVKLLTETVVFLLDFYMLSIKQQIRSFPKIPINK